MVEPCTSILQRKWDLIVSLPFVLMNSSSGHGKDKLSCRIRRFRKGAGLTCRIRVIALQEPLDSFGLFRFQLAVHCCPMNGAEQITRNRNPMKTGNKGRNQQLLEMVVRRGRNAIAATGAFSVFLV